MKGEKNMEDKSLCITPNTLCINTDRVYDWVIEEAESSTTIPAIGMPLTIPLEATNVKATCILTDAAGVPLPINTELNVTETAPRENHQFTVDNTVVTLQRVIFTKVIYVVLEVTGVDSTTGTQFLIQSNPIQLNFMETIFLCAPPGTTLLVRVSNFSCLTVINRDGTGAIIDFQLNINICQSIQMVAPVTVEVRADMCSPRKILTEHCGNVSIPPRCPSVFPRR